MTDEPKPLPTMGDALKGIQERLSQFPSRGEYGDNGVIAWFLGLEADNNELRALVKEQDETIKENTRAMAVGCRFREGLEGARKALESNQPHAALALIETALLYKP